MAKNVTAAPRVPAIKPDTTFSPIDLVSEDDSGHAEHGVRRAETSPVEHRKRTGLTLSEDEPGTAGGNRDH